MTRRKMAYALVSVLIIGIGWFAWKLTARGAYETAEYSVVESDAMFEIRDYPDLLLVSTGMQFESQGDDGSFMRLFRYISGSNEKSQKVAMTTPVFMEDHADHSPGLMGFVIPKAVASRGAPTPSSEDVQLRERSGGRFAVIRFSGRINPEIAADAECRLRQWISSRGLRSNATAEIAGYDPPWTPGFLRRNEVLLKIQR